MEEKICCVLCMKVLGEIDFEDCFLEEYKSQKNVEEQIASFKCLNLETKYVSELFRELQNSDYFDHLGIRIPRIYCTACHARNGEIYKVLTQLADLESKYNSLKGSVLEDFKRTFLSNQNLNEVEVRQDGVQEQLNNIRIRAAKGLKLLSGGSVALFEEDDDWEPCVIPAVEYSDSEAIDSEICKVSLEKENDLRRAYQISDCHVVLERLSPELLRLMTLRKTSEEAKTENKKKDAKEKQFRRFRCIFDDCNIKTPFMTILGRNAHLIKKHSLTEDEILELDEQIAQKEYPIEGQLDPAKENSSGKTVKRPRILKCTFDDCLSEEIFETSLLLREHLEGVHCIQVSESEYDSDSSSAPTKKNGQGDTSGAANVNNLSDTVPLKCVFDDCDYFGMFSTKSDLLKHVKDIHDVELSESDLPQCETNEDPLKPPNLRLKCLYVDCPIRKRFPSRRDRRAHVKKYHESNAAASEKMIRVNTIRGKKRILCKIPNCKVRKYFISEEALDEHMKWVHEGSPNRYRCTHCNQYFTTRQERNGHIEKEHVGVFKDICHVCGKCFKSAKDLERHMITHTDERPFKCKYCPSSFRTAGGVDYHQRAIHTKEYRYHCDQCGKSFIDSVKFKTHVNCVHKSERPCICEVCGKGFPIQSYLNVHIKKVHKRAQAMPVRKRPPKPKSDNDTLPKQRKPRMRRVPVDQLIVHPPLPLVGPGQASSSYVINSCSNSLSAPVDLTQDYAVNPHDNEDYNYAQVQDHSRSANTTPSTVDSTPGEIPYPTNTVHHSQQSSNQFHLSGFQYPGQAFQNQLIPNQYLQFMNNYGNYNTENQRRN